MTDSVPPPSGASPKPTPTREDVAARLAAVQEREAAEYKAQERRRGNQQGVGLAMRIGIELVAAVMVGSGLGWFLDDKFGTSPVFLLALVCLGFTAGVMNVIRLAKGLDKREGIGWGKDRKENVAPPPRTTDDDDD